jgi:adenine C2-methylase RlmN of 23S rRNA A2503 and tRNA A37
VPTNDKVGLEAILDAADYFQAKTGRQVTYEYVLLRDVNDGAEHAAGSADARPVADRFRVHRRATDGVL